MKKYFWLSLFFIICLFLAQVSYAETTCSQDYSSYATCSGSLIAELTNHEPGEECLDFCGSVDASCVRRCWDGSGCGAGFNDGECECFDGGSSSNGDYSKVWGGSCTPYIECYFNSDCGVDGYSSYFCQDGNVYGDYKIYTCNNAGTASSYCSDSTTVQLVDECSFNEECIDGNGECQLRDITCYKDYETYATCSGSLVAERTDHPSEQDCLDFCGEKKASCVRRCWEGSGCGADFNDGECECFDGGSSQTGSYYRVWGGSCTPDVKCYFNSDCGVDGYSSYFCQDGDVYGDYKIYTCNDAGTNSSYCSDSTIPNLIDDCVAGEGCVAGNSECQLINVICSKDYNDYATCSGVFIAERTDHPSEQVCLDFCAEQRASCVKRCWDGSGCGTGFNDGECECWTGDSTNTGSYNKVWGGNCMLEGGGAVISCYYNTDCGTNEYLGNYFCQNDDVYRDYRAYLCNSAGTTESHCSDETNPQLIDNCSVNEECIEGGSECQQLEINCTLDSDCGTDYYIGNYFCQDDDVYRDYQSFTCNNAGTPSSYCTNSTIPDLIDDCVAGEECVEGNSECQPTINCTSNSDCGADGYVGDYFCQDDDVYIDFITYTCSNPGTIGSFCSDETNPQLIDNCSVNEECINNNSECQVKEGACFVEYDTNSDCEGEFISEITNHSSGQECLDFCASVGAGCVKRCWEGSGCGADFEDGDCECWSGVSNQTGSYFKVWGGNCYYEKITFYQDSDGDGYGNPNSTVEEFIQPSGYLLNNTDCNDTNATINPNATEICNGIDDDCDSIIDNVPDIDGDGFNLCQGDCNESNILINPGANETCDNVDEDCDGLIDEGLARSYYTGPGGTEGVGICTAGTEACEAGVWNVTIPDITPEVDVCDGLDNDCNSTIDDGFDLDNDNFTTCEGDCDDTDAAINPNGTEVCDGLDNDCNNFIDDGVCAGTCIDDDNDKYGVNNDSSCQKSGFDCDDSDNKVNPEETESCASPYDDNCDGTANEGCDNDLDGFTVPTDCNDENDAINPNATEVCNSQDDNCDGQVDEMGGCIDSDGDSIVDAIDICPSDPDNECNINQTQLYVTTNTSTLMSTENGEVALQISQGDFASDTVVTLEKNADLQPNFALSTGTSAVKNVYSYTFSPEGQQFDGDFIVAMYWDDADNDGKEDMTGLSENKIDIYWYNPITTKWEAQDATCNLINNYCTLITDHFSDYAMAIAVDDDNDTYYADDCNDSDASINPGAAEVCDGVDNNCDGLIDGDCPGELKQDSIDSLEDAKEDEKLCEGLSKKEKAECRRENSKIKRMNRRIDKVIDNIEKSLKEVYWVDGSRLSAEKGKDNGKYVFQYESKAAVLCPVKGKAYEELRPVCEQVRDNLVSADIQLAQTALDDAENSEVQNEENQKCYDSMLKNANKAMTKAEEKKDKPGISIINSRNAWRFAQKTIKFAESSEDICSKKG